MSASSGVPAGFTGGAPGLTTPSPPSAFSIVEVKSPPEDEALGP